jgi:hypothetical protein
MIATLGLTDSNTANSEQATMISRTTTTIRPGLHERNSASESMTGAATRQPFEEELNGRCYREVNVAVASGGWREGGGYGASDDRRS